MKMLLQRVLSAKVEVEGEKIGEIERGILLFLGVECASDEEKLEKAVQKVLSLRIFEDENEKINLSAADVGAQILVVSQFTLCADCSKGNRPGFSNAAPPSVAEPIYEKFFSLCEGKFSKVARGKFGADMKVSLVNDGPFTIWLEM